MVPKDMVEVLTRCFESHIAALQLQIKDQRELIRTLSDDKYFKPNVAPVTSKPLETITTLRASDFSFQTDLESELSEPETQDEEPGINLEAELTELETAHAKYVADRQ